MKVSKHKKELISLIRSKLNKTFKRKLDDSTSSFIEEYIINHQMNESELENLKKEVQHKLDSPLTKSQSVKSIRSVPKTAVSVDLAVAKPQHMKQNFLNLYTAYPVLSAPSMDLQSTTKSIYVSKDPKKSEYTLYLESLQRMHEQNVQQQKQRTAQEKKSYSLFLS